MKRFTISEYGRIERSALADQVVQRLQRLDERNAVTAGDTVFDWGRLREIKAKNYVGVIQVPGLSIEILPKIDAVDGDATARAQDNLLYMLQLSRNLPLRHRDLADQHLRRKPLLEALIQSFANRLLSELRSGVHHAYVTREANQQVVRGRLLLHQHLQINRTRRDRLFVRFDEFISDTPLNRILKRACRRLMTVTRSNRTSQLLCEALLEMADVSDVEIRRHHFDQLTLDRAAERFRPLVSFCRMVIESDTSTPASGGLNTFSLLFPMERVFEEFIGHFIRRHARQLNLDRRDIHLQAASRGKWLLTSESSAGKFRLRPDIVVDGLNAAPYCILDTKWKRLKSDLIDPNNGVQQGDLYQLYAYAHRYNSPLNILLYPRVENVTNKTFTLADDAAARRLRVAFVDLGQDLYRDSTILLRDLAVALG